MADSINFSTGKTSSGNGRCSRRTLLLLLVFVSIIVIALVIVIAVTYVKELQCDDETRTHSQIHNSTMSNSNNSISFFLFSDVHLDQFYNVSVGKKGFCRNKSMPSTYDAPYGRIGCDSPLKLLQEVLKAMKEHENNLPNLQLDFVMLSGDISGHNIKTNRRKAVLENMYTTSKEVMLTFPNIPFFPSIGNNDLPGHYVMPVENDTWYSDLLSIWEEGILCKHCNMSYETTTAAKLRKTFLYGGYYSVSIAGGNMTLLVLNSMYWTNLTWKADDYFQKRAVDQMNWVEEQLQLAKSTNKKVILTSHIPPGIDFHADKPRWLSNFTDLYMDLVTNKFSKVVAAQIYAHFHKDSFRFLQANKKDTSYKNSSYVLLMPSLSPIYRNNPNFRVVHLDPGLRAIKDYEQWYMNLVMATEFHKLVWQLDYKFSSRYPPSGIDDQVINGKRIKNLCDNLINPLDDSFFNGFISSRQVRYQPDPNYSRFKFYCALMYYSQDDYDACRKKYITLLRDFSGCKAG